MPVHQWLAQWSSWGWPLFANHLWLATLLSLAALATVAFLKDAPGRSRYAVMLIASAKFASPSAVIGALAGRFGVNGSSLFASNATAEAPAFVYQLTAPVAQIAQLEGPASASVQAAPGHNELFCALTIIWMTVFAVLLALWWTNRRRFRIATTLDSVAEATRERQALDRVKSWLGIKRDVRLRVLPHMIEPGVWGVFRPVVILPQSMAGQLDDAELEAVMMHEMIHVARWDNLVANCHRLLCCLLWFHPLVWMLDRLLLAERERACDDEVIRLGGASEVYASSLLKVLRFCLGWKVAGASNATGSNLGRRVERIMSRNVQMKLTMWHRVAVCSIATLVIVLSIAAGLLTRSSAVAQNNAPVRGVIGGIPGGVAGAAQEVRIPQAVESGTDGTIVRWLKKIGDSVDRDEPLFELSVGNRNFNVPAPVAGVLTRITVQEGQTVPVNTVVAVIDGVPGVIGGIPGGVPGGIPGGVPGGVPGSVTGVVTRFGWAADNNHFMEALDQAPESPIEFKNSAKSPLAITGAKVRQLPSERATPDDLYAVVPVVTLVNNTDRRIKGFTLEFRNGPERRAYYEPVPSFVEARGVYTSGRQNRFVVLAGGASGWTVKVAGVLFEDGDSWGVVPPPPPPPPPPPSPRSPDSPKPPPPPPPLDTDSPKLIRKSGGVLTTSAIKRVEPEYPDQAKAARISGTVVVEITVDETGNVISARAISGHPLLKAAAVDAARQWQFSPTTLSGEPVRVVGTLTFNFAL